MKYSIKVESADSSFEIITGENANEVFHKVSELKYIKEHYVTFTTEEARISFPHNPCLKDEHKNTAKFATGQILWKIRKQSDLLKRSLTHPISVSWDYIITEFLANNPEPEQPILPNTPKILPYPIKPDKNADKYQPNLNVIDILFSARKDAILKGCEERFNNDYTEWEKENQRIEEINHIGVNDYYSLVEELKKQFSSDHREWEYKRDEVYREQKRYKDEYKLCSVEGIEKYFEIVLKSSKYEDEFFIKNIFVKYFSNNNLLFVEYYLPDKKDLVEVKGIKYVPSIDEFQEVIIPERELNKKYDLTLYEITLRTLNELFQLDDLNQVDQVVFNGYVQSIDKSTGNQIAPCIISLSVSKQKFHTINLNDIDPKECFKGLKGVSAAILHSITPVTPIMQFDKNDKRIIEGYKVVDGINDETNIAAMGWEDFEHLIREIFEKEFSQNGGEVKVTQASRDGGVDAIAFDPDPIRGGKIVIQAKRYTNVVGVAAVRDLYGTVMNEGATKGILVTTSNYGSDAYEFAKGKPLTLLNGSNLLHLLEKHGHKAKIDIIEAKKILFEKESNKTNKKL